MPGGVKPSYLADNGHTLLNPPLPDEDFGQAVRIAQAEFDRHHPEVIVGSSRGGAVAMSLHTGDARLVLLCPAWRKYGSARTVKAGAVILHSRADDVVPFADSEELVRVSGLPASALIEVGTDHRLADPEPLRQMLQACEAWLANQLQIRCFADADANEVAALWNTVFAYAAPHNEPTAVIRQKLAVQRELFLVAVLDGSVVGTVMGGYDGHRGWVYSLAVDPRARRQGIGTALMKHLEQKLAARGCPKVNLQVLASNAGTVEFYRKLGYAVEERISMGKLL